MNVKDSLLAIRKTKTQKGEYHENKEKPARLENKGRNTASDGSG